MGNRSNEAESAAGGAAHISGMATAIKRADEQIKTRDRVRDLAEVYTAKEQVDAMLDLVASECRHLDTTFLEPACGNGNFLAEILRRKIQRIHKPKGGEAGLEQFEHRTLRAVASIYGVDIDPENVKESRERMHSIVIEHHSYKANSMRASEEFRAALEEILETNIICGDTLAGAHEIDIVEYKPNKRFGFIRTVHNFDDLKHPERMPMHPLGMLPEVHYTELASTKLEEAA
jgi:SAM-dependent methyltransferase